MPSYTMPGEALWGARRLMIDGVDEVRLARDLVDGARHAALGRDTGNGPDTLPVLLVGLDEGHDLAGVLLALNHPALGEGGTHERADAMNRQDPLSLPSTPISPRALG